MYVADALTLGADRPHFGARVRPGFPDAPGRVLLPVRLAIGEALMSDSIPTAPPFGAPLSGAAAPTVTCARCGTIATVGSRFCPSCGAALTPTGEVTEDQLLVRLRQATLGEYDVLREVGHGGMAAVYLAWDRELARYVAIKVLLPELAHHPTMSQRFLQEARTAANLDDHPSVVRVYRAKEAQGLRYFVMKYVDGCSLEQLLRSAGPLPPDLAAHVVDQVALALQYAHEHGVVHRDVKPGNILLDRAGGVVVTDFGIAKVAEAEQLTRTGFAIGTPHYMSPEQWRVEPLTPASDQYALGVVAFHLVTGEVPFDGTQYAIQEQHLRSEPPVLSARRDGVPAAFGAVVRVMLAKAPAERFPDLRSVSQALSAIPRDAAPVLRERLSRLIPAANTPGVREVPPPDVTPPAPEVVIERRSGAAAAVAPPEGPWSGPPAPPATPGFAPVATPVPTPPVARPIVPPVAPPVAPAFPVTPAEVAPKVAPTTFVPLPSLSTPVVSPRPTPVAEHPAVDPAPPPAPIRVERPTPALNLTTTFRTQASVDPAPVADVRTPDPAPRSAETSPAPASVAEAIPVETGSAVPLLDGPITRRESNRRIWPWLTAAVVTAMLVGGWLATKGGTSTTPPVATAPVPTPSTAAPPTAAASAPAAAPVDPATVATTPVDPTTDPAGAELPPPPANAGPPGPPSALLVVGAPVTGSVSAGDSVRLRARVNDARGTRLVNATVQWASSDPAHVAFRNGWAVGIAPGGPVSVTATSGPLTRAVKLTVTPRAGVPAPRVVIARPTPAELRTEVQRFVASLEAHDVAEVSRRLTARALDGSSAREFVTWLEGTPGLTADTPALGEASDEGTRARVAFRVPMRWRAAGGAAAERVRRDVTFWMTLSHDDQGWHGGEVLLGNRVAP